MIVQNAKAPGRFLLPGALALLFDRIKIGMIGF